MPKYSPDTLESCESVEKVIHAIISDPEKRYKFLVDLSRVLNIKKGVVSFRPYIIYHRRKAVEILFDGKNKQEIARKLGVSEKTIENDIKHNYGDSRKRRLSR